jgi:hypothetical protein
VKKGPGYLKKRNGDKANITISAAGGLSFLTSIREVRKIKNNPE